MQVTGTTGGAATKPTIEYIERDGARRKKPTNEEVLHVAFYSFVVFLLVQAVFALIANSKSMLADSEAMSVDAITYLFNLCAERIQNRPFTETELSLTPEERDYRRELQRLYLEMIPPSISVLVLIAITCYAFMDAFETLYEIDSSSDNDDDVSVPIMFVFSGVNLLLDVVNVTCFARADMNFSLDILRQERSLIRESMRGLHIDSPDMDAENENTKFLSPTANHQTYDGVVIDTEAASFAPTSLMVNLNMCSAWTVRTVSVSNGPSGFP